MLRLPEGLSLEKLAARHDRKNFFSGEEKVDQWFKGFAKQSQDKNLSRTTLLLNEAEEVLGFYTLVISYVSFEDLPISLRYKLPNAVLPAMKLTWLGVDESSQGQGLGAKLLASAMNDCYCLGQELAFCFVLLDCVSPVVKDFYQQFGFYDLPGHRLKMALPWKALKQMASYKS